MGYQRNQIDQILYVIEICYSEFLHQDGHTAICDSRVAFATRNVISKLNNTFVGLGNVMKGFIYCTLPTEANQNESEQKYYRDD